MPSSPVWSACGRRNWRQSSTGRLVDCASDRSRPDGWDYRPWRSKDAGNRAHAQESEAIGASGSLELHSAEIDDQSMGTKEGKAASRGGL